MNSAKCCCVIVEVKGEKGLHCYDVSEFLCFLNVLKAKSEILALKAFVVLDPRPQHRGCQLKTDLLALCYARQFLRKYPDKAGLPWLISLQPINSEFLITFSDLRSSQHSSSLLTQGAILIYGNGLNDLCVFPQFLVLPARPISSCVQRSCFWLTPISGVRLWGTAPSLSPPLLSDFLFNFYTTSPLSYLKAENPYCLQLGNVILPQPSAGLLPEAYIKQLNPGTAISVRSITRGDPSAGSLSTGDPRIPLGGISVMRVSDTQSVKVSVVQSD
ncbi:hypothetical protein RRG08_034791 [Elysia crispata]|uniref:Uncharacterized protein n=1 Tax=Elysia crispata TaxID=231223 RepID=A0AAE0YAK9_9GAST|nr:hypothetical protein RRG08_034791 [Elysia crispata]